MVRFGDCNRYRNTLTVLNRLRVHAQQEWADWLSYQDDPALSFDCYLKGIKNNWQQTAPVRLSQLKFSPNTPDIIDRPLPTYPLLSTSLKTYYFEAAKKSPTPEPTMKESSASYAAADMKSEIRFDLVFSEHTELAGYPKLNLWMQCHEHGDMDIFALLGKIDKLGKPLLHVQLLAKGDAPSQIAADINVVQ